MKPIYKPAGRAGGYGNSPFSRPLDKNGNWSGGRILSSHGYVRIKMPNHPHADVGGYVYEHRLVMEQKLGRYLEPGEIVHHLNEDKQDNSPDNLVLASDIATHKAYHRKRQDLRSPNEGNPLVYCACGCGRRFNKYDSIGRPRMFISGHSKRLKLSRETREQIRQLNASGKSTRAIAKQFNISKTLAWRIVKGDAI